MIGRLWPVLALAAAIGGVWGMLVVGGVRSGTWLDTTILGMIGGTYALACLVMLAGTADWTARNTGLLGTLAGDAWVWGGLALIRLGWLETGDWFTNGFRAIFLVSSPILAAGLVAWVVAEARARRTEEP